MTVSSQEVGGGHSLQVACFENAMGPASGLEGLDIETGPFPARAAAAVYDVCNCPLCPTEVGSNGKLGATVDGRRREMSSLCASPSCQLLRERKPEMPGLNAA